MTENELTYVKIEATGFQDICNKLAEVEKQNKELILDAHETVKELEEKNQQLRDQLSRTTRFKMGLKLRNRKLTEERNELIEELNTIKSMDMWEFANKYCSDSQLEEAGHALARSFGIGGK